MQDEERRTASDAQMEALERLAKIDDRLAMMVEQISSNTAEVRLQNGRIASLETWRAEHQPWSEGGRDLIQAQVDAIADMQEKLTQTMLQTQRTNKDFERTIVRVLDERQTSQDAAQYRALTKRFGPDVEESLSRWKGLEAGTRAVGWKVITTIVTVLVTALLAAMLSLWVVS